jgi:hypothetical protein
MGEFILVLFVLGYSVVAVKVDEWITVAALGFASETPLMFLTHPRRYHMVRSALFLGAIGTAFFLTSISGVIWVPALGIVWLMAGWLGRKKACNTYRRVLCEMAASANTAERKTRYEAELGKTDQELMEEADRAVRLGVV